MPYIPTYCLQRSTGGVWGGSSLARGRVSGGVWQVPGACTLERDCDLFGCLFCIPRVVSSVHTCHKEVALLTVALLTRKTDLHACHTYLPTYLLRGLTCSRPYFQWPYLLWPYLLGRVTCSRPSSSGSTYVVVGSRWQVEGS